MSITLPGAIFDLHGQVVKKFNFDTVESTVTVCCRRDKRFKPIDPLTKQMGTVNRYLRRSVKDIPLCQRPCIIDIELAEVRLRNGARRIEACDFVDKGCYYTKRFCQLVSGFCRHMTIQAVAKHFRLRWETVKNMDKSYLESSLPGLNPRDLSHLKYIGVDEVARAKGHDYMTVVYDLVSGRLIWVEAGRTTSVFSEFLKQLTPQCAAGIRGVAMDMGPAYQRAVRDYLPQADIIFDRFHVMQMFSRAIDNQRRIEFRKADNKGRLLMKGCRYLLLRNQDKLEANQKQKLKSLLDANKNLHAMYTLKEQLQALWTYTNYEDMGKALDDWCVMADQTDMLYMKKMAKSLQKHKIGICNYTKHALTTARIEAGNVGIGLIRKRARGICDTEYFKLKIRQLGTPETESLFYKSGERDNCPEIVW